MGRIKLYNWLRFWSPLDANVNLDDEGFLSDPITSFYEKEANPQLLTVSNLISEQCLILLGEPGTGKSIELQKLYDLTKKELEATNSSCLKFDLKNYSSDLFLVREIFENNEFVSWKEGFGNLYLFLDSLDEGIITIRQLVNVISSELEKIKRIENLYLRIACRTFEWPPSLEFTLKKLWPKEYVKVIELAPLRKVDVIEAARAENVDAELLLKEILDKEITSLSIKPLTLNFLISLFKNTGGFSTTKASLYEDGCKQLCLGGIDIRDNIHHNPNLSPAQRLIVAGRIAAIMLLSNKLGITTNSFNLDEKDSSLLIGTLVGKTEKIDNIEFQITQAEIIDVLSSGLFSARGSDFFGFAHQAYLDFLAAWYINKRNLPIQQIVNLIFGPSEDNSEKLVPQLYEMIAWLAIFRDDLFDKVVSSEPSVLLLGDISNISDDQKSSLVDSLLHLYGENKIFDPDWNIYRRYKKLAHPKLYIQLLEYITDTNKGLAARQTAIEIAEACHLSTIQDKLAEIALDQTEDLRLRIISSSAVSRIGDSDTKKRLLPLAQGKAGDDPDDDLKGWGFKALWPDQISTKELFEYLTPIKKENYFGSYNDFIYGIIYNANLLDISEALRWVENRERRALSWKSNELIDAIMVEGWNHINDPEILNLYAQIIYNNLTNFEGILHNPNNLPEKIRIQFLQILEIDTINRQLLITAVLQRFFTNNNPDFLSLAYHQPPLVYKQDLDWLLHLLILEECQERKKAICAIIFSICDKTDEQQMEKIYPVTRQEDLLAHQFQTVFGPVIFGSQEEVEMKRFYERNLKMEEERNKNKKSSQFLLENIEIALNELEDETKTEAWLKICFWLTCIPNSNQRVAEGLDLTELPCWVIVDANTKKRIFNASLQYIENGDPLIESWLNKNIISRNAIAGYQALLLVLRICPDNLSELLPSIWEKWAPIILANSGFYREETRIFYVHLLSLAYKNAPDTIIETIETIIDREKESIGLNPYIWKLASILDEELANVIIAKIKTTRIHPDSLYELLSVLIKKGFPVAITYAKSLILNPPALDNEIKKQSFSALKAFFYYSPDAGWDVIWPKVISDTDFGREFFEKIGEGPIRYSDQLVSKISEAKVGELCLWLFQQFPPGDDPEFDEAHHISPREEIGNWRDSLVHALALKGTRESKKELEFLSSQLPEIATFKWLILEADLVSRRNTWKPFHPSDVAKILLDNDLRLVQHEDHLLSIIIESLNRLQQNLQGETPESVFLWNDVSKNIYQPKEENRLSDYIKRHLYKDLKESKIIVNREVQISPPIGSTEGENTDISIQAIDQESNDVVSVLLETKCIWNKELLTAMEKQLANRYLKNNQRSHGIYLVGWYKCPQWDNEDYRKKRNQKYSKTQLIEILHERALVLSSQSKKIISYVLDVSLRHNDPEQ